MTDGWIKLHRKSLDSAVWQDPDLWRLWTLCLLLANHEEKDFQPGKGQPSIPVKPGQFVTGRENLRDHMYPRGKKHNRSASTVWRWLNTLKMNRMLNIETNSRYSVVTICNWEHYQKKEKENEQKFEQKSDTEVNNSCTTVAQQLHTNKNDKNDKNTTGYIRAGAREAGLPISTYVDRHIFPYPHQPESQAIMADMREVLKHLNVSCDKNYPETYNGNKHILYRLAEGRTIQEHKDIIDKKRKDTEFNRNYLRPDTLFTESNFDKYLHEKESEYGRNGGSKEKTRVYTEPGRKYTFDHEHH